MYELKKESQKIVPGLYLQLDFGANEGVEMHEIGFEGGDASIVSIVLLKIDH